MWPYTQVQGRRYIGCNAYLHVSTIVVVERVSALSIEGAFPQIPEHRVYPILPKDRRTFY